MSSKKMAFGIITRNIDSTIPIRDFLENASKFEHQIDHIIIAYNDEKDDEVIAELEKYCSVTAIKRGDAPILYSYLAELGLSKEEADRILATPFKKKFDLVSYGTSRNYVLIAALMLKIDFLFFFDTDIFPKILTQFHDETEYKFQEIDFVGSHLKFLKKEKVVLTTSDYTGYYIIPKMNFPYLMELLRGVQKEDRFYYISSVDTPVVRNSYLENIFETKKALGGNLGINLDHFGLLPPFFSTILQTKENCYLGRGEDTLFGPEIYHKGGKCIDIDLLIFHNCFGDFPEKPAIEKQKNIDRFFYACVGWIARNPFLNWLKKEYGLETETINYQKRLDALKVGSSAAAKYFHDERFLFLPEAYITAYKSLNSEIERFQKLMKVWEKMRKQIKKGDN